MAASLSTAERRILEAAIDAHGDGMAATRLTDVVRRALGQLPGHEFRRGVARLAERRLIRARVAIKADGDVGRVVIEDITPLGHYVIHGVIHGASRGASRGIVRPPSGRGPNRR